LSRKKLNVLSLAKDDRVFGLAFAKDSRFLYSGHGSGRILEWNLESGNKKPVRQAVVDFSISAMAMSEIAGQKLLLIAGRYNQLALWDLRSGFLYHVRYRYQTDSSLPSSQKQPETKESFASQQQYIESMAAVKSTLATADNQGYISLWDLSERRCRTSSKPIAKQKNITLFTRSQFCDLPLLNQWQDGHQKKPVRSVAFTNDGCYLASTGDDGRVMIWLLAASGRRVSETEDNKNRTSIEIAKINTRLNSVDAVVNQNMLLIASDDYDNQIRFYRINEQNLNRTCQS
jgi:WD40 repeat protein